MFDPDTTIELGDVTLAVDDRGGGDGIPLVLVHGFTGGRIDFIDVIDTLATDRRVVAWDHRGHGDSTNTGDRATYTFDSLVADAVGAVDALGLDRFHLLGHSMGGVVAQRLVFEHPARVASLILMDTLAEPALSIPEEWIDMVTALAAEQDMVAVADLFEASTGGQSVAPEDDRPRILERNRHKLTHMDPEAFAGLASALREFPPTVGRLPSISCPVTVVVGELDVPLRGQADAIAAAIPDAALVVIDGAAHCPQEERPDAWLAAIRAHLDRANPDNAHVERAHPERAE